MDFLAAFWPWYITGPLIGLYVPVLYILKNRHFGVSSSFRDICAAALRPKAEYFQYGWKDHQWRIIFVAGIAIGGFLTRATLKTSALEEISPHTLSMLTSIGVKDFSTLIPGDLFSLDRLLTLRSLLLVVLGGFLVGFGTRYAEGCTSGHSIHGIATFQRTSLIATAAFFLGGLISTYLLLPVIIRM